MELWARHRILGRSRYTLAACLALALTAVVALAGCSASDPSPVTDYRGEPHGVAAPPSSAGGAAFAVWLKDGKQFAVTLYGSSTCPPKSSSFRVIGSNKLKLALEPLPDRPCTMDYVPHTTVFATPSALRITRDVQIVVPPSQPAGASTTLTLPGR
ncbi:MAG: hypothetical protein ABI255_10975 [Microbacteriaceae bacterium]